MTNYSGIFKRVARRGYLIAYKRDSKGRLIYKSNPTIDENELNQLAESNGALIEKIENNSTLFPEKCFDRVFRVPNNEQAKKIHDVDRLRMESDGYFLTELERGECFYEYVYSYYNSESDFMLGINP